MSDQFRAQLEPQADGSWLVSIVEGPNPGWLNSMLLSQRLGLIETKKYVRGEKKARKVASKMLAAVRKADANKRRPSIEVQR